MGKFNILIGDITSEEILKGHDAIVNPTNPRMVCGLGVSGAIFHKAGVNKLERYTQSKYNINYYSDDNLMKVGEVRVTPGFDLGMDIIFVQGPVKDKFDNAKDVLLETYKKLLNEIEFQDYHNVLCCSLGTGHYGFTHAEVGKDVSNLISAFVKDKNINIDLVIYDQNDKQYYIN